MSKVIVERPRRGHSGGWDKPGRTRVLLDEDGEPLRAREPRRTRPVRTKSLNENLAPLRRYLGKQIGRPWNKVYSEISENLKPTSTVQQHVRDHLKDFVAVETRMRADGIVASHVWGGERALQDDYRPFYVHPRTGLLRANPHYRSWTKRLRERRKAEAEARAQRMREIDARTQLHKLKDEVWWEVKLARSGPGNDEDAVLAAGLSELSADELYGRSGVRAVGKRVLSKSEKKKLGLS
ncbi:MAG: hypothetical protein R3C52_03930 [Hyphomonadaceae bacterium]